MTSISETMALERVTEHVVRIPLPLPLQDLHTVNCYAILGEQGIALIDPGWASAESEAALNTALEALGYSPQDVTATLVTHSHWDRYTLALQWRQKYGIPVHLGREEHHSIDAFAQVAEPYPFQIDQLRRAGAPDIATQVETTPWEPYEVGMPFGPPDVWLEDGAKIDCGGRTIVAHSTPGHTRGHIVFEDPSDGLLFTGDHVLPRITPAVAFERDPQELPLSSYLGSLKMLLDAPMRQCCPRTEPSLTASRSARRNCSPIMTNGSPWSANSSIPAQERQPRSHVR